MVTLSTKSKKLVMKGADTLMNLMDEVQRIVEYLNTYVEKASHFLTTIKEWVNKIIEFISQGIEKLSQWTGGRRADHLQHAEDYLFV